MSDHDGLLARVHLDSGDAPYVQSMRAGRHELTADEPPSVGGADAGPGPYNLVVAGLIACTSITLRMYADRKGWQLGPVHIDATMRRDGDVEIIERTITLAATVTAEQQAKLAEIAEKTPVTKTLKRATTIVTRIDLRTI
jgi:putative redox protein